MDKSSGRSWTFTVAAGAACLALAAMTVSVPAGAQEDPQPRPAAEIRTGTCAAPGDIVALLAPVPGDGMLDEAPAAVATSVTEVPLPFAELSGEPHVITLEGLGDAGLLCAAISGPEVEGPGLASALATEDGAVAGIAWLRELGLRATNVHVFLVAEPMVPMIEPAPGATPDPDPSPDPDASPSPAPDGSPSPDPDDPPAPEGGGIPEGEVDPREDIDVDVAD